MYNPFEILNVRLSNIENLLLEIKHSPQNSSIDKESDAMLTINQASNFLKLAVPTIYGMVSRKEIPFNKPGKRLYFSKQELTEWVKSGRKKTIMEIETEAEEQLVSVKRKG